MTPFWQTSRFQIDLSRPRVMGIVNVTPDSFSDGGEHDSVDAAVAHGATVIVAPMAVGTLGTMAVLADPKRSHDGLFPELVLFDCHACHHPMSDKRWTPRVGSASPWRSSFGPRRSRTRRGSAACAVIRARNASSMSRTCI